MPLVEVSMAKKGKAQVYFEYAAARALLSGLGALPRPLAVAAGRAVGHAAYALAGGLRRTGLRNLELALPELDESGRKRILRGSFVSLGRQLGEVSQFPRTTAERLREVVEYDSEDVKLLDFARGRGRGVIFLTSHLGAWELLCFAHSVFYEPISFLVRPADNPLIEEMVRRLRTRFGNRPVDKKAAARTALRLLRQGGTLGVLADLNTQEREGVFVPFFGHLACTTAGVATLALRTDATVIPVCAPWDERRRKFVFRGGPVVELVRTGDDERDIEINTARFTAAIERHVRMFPDQWLWIHKRWKTRPPGEPDLYVRKKNLRQESGVAKISAPPPTEKISKA
ncbi:MAG: lipid A biosynthesis acyltransferase [Acidobacteria bacterium]|nr:MAG: lipid A biosynthesis acyltransferase [Acidobacteriota bacterium]PYS84777.1 MAG: lipid A biosynthesis acyltransferase [Acidobacteriota bacterium]